MAPAWEHSGDDQAGAEFGGSVASAGDVNGDGYGDDQVGSDFGFSVASAGNVLGCCSDLVIVGAYDFRAASVQAGKAYVLCIGP